MRIAIRSSIVPLLAAAWLSTAGTAGAASLQLPMQFSTFRACTDSSAACAPQLLASGRFERDSAQRLSDFLADKEGLGLPPSPTVVFHSPGGNIAGALDMGRLLRRLKFGTRVAASVPDGQAETASVCASACALAFLGGVRRRVEPGARFGVHQFALAAGGNMGDSATQGTMVRLASYVSEMGVDRRLLDLASLVPPSRMYWVTPDQLRLLKVDTTARTLAPWELRAAADGSPLIRVQQLAPEGGRVSSIVLQRAGDTVNVLVGIALARRAVTPDALARFPVGEAPAIAFTVDGGTLRAQPAQAWQRADSATYYQFKASAMLPLSALQALGRAQTLAVSDGLDPSLADLALATDLSTENLGPDVALMLRGP